MLHGSTLSQYEHGRCTCLCHIHSIALDKRRSVEEIGARPLAVPLRFFECVECAGDGAGEEGVAGAFGEEGLLAWGKGWLIRVRGYFLGWGYREDEDPPLAQLPG
jgi:hypothetical protein